MKQYILALFFMVISLSVTAREERGCFPNETPPCYKYERLPHDECKFVPIDAVDPDDICGPPAPTNNSSKQTKPKNWNRTKTYDEKKPRH